MESTKEATYKLHEIHGLPANNIHEKSRKRSRSAYKARVLQTHLAIARRECETLRMATAHAYGQLQLVDTDREQNCPGKKPAVEDPEEHIQENPPTESATGNANSVPEASKSDTTEFFKSPDRAKHVLMELNKLKSLPKITDNPKVINEFASKVRSSVTAIKSLEVPAYLLSPLTATELHAKLTTVLRYRLYDFMAERKEDDKYFNLELISEFLNIQVDISRAYAF